MSKPRASLIFTKAQLEVAKVGTMGAIVYGDQDWRNNPLPWSKHMDAAIRHMLDYNNGIRKDIDLNCPDCNSNKCEKHSGLSHLAHAAWRILALLDYEIHNVGNDDLFRGYTKKE